MSDDLIKRLILDECYQDAERVAQLEMGLLYRDHHIEALETKLAKALEALEKLARLGNGDRYGNSEGNMIARAALEGDKE